MPVTELLGFIAGGISMFQSVPQVLRIRALGHGRGVSLASWIMQAVNFTSWLAYGLATSSPSVTITNIVSGSLAVAVIMSIVDRRGPWMLALLGLGAAAFVDVTRLPEDVVSVYLVSLMTAMLPQIRASLRNFQQRLHSAVSVRAMTLGCTSLVLWGLYAILEQRTLMIITASIGLSMMLLITALEYGAARRYTLSVAHQ